MKPQPAPPLDPIAVFTARCQARARLWANGDLDLHEATDTLWAAAIDVGLVEEIGADRVQEIISEAFARFRKAELTLPRDPRLSDGTHGSHLPPPERPILPERPADMPIWQHVPPVPFPSAHELQRMQDAAIRRQREEYGAAGSTVEALMYSLREEGLAALRDRSTLRRLDDLSTAQVREVIARLIRLRASYPAVTDDLLLKLGKLLP